ncbi:hypothetical protein J32TS6_29710 [Virgibacillus pantothenticus]|nr:hypothetical protein J32TS6_29710 [Virgibacillus pantothenticus]
MPKKYKIVEVRHRDSASTISQPSFSFFNTFVGLQKKLSILGSHVNSCSDFFMDHNTAQVMNVLSFLVSKYY